MGLQIIVLISDFISCKTKVREAHNTTACINGTPITCGQTIRLTHVGTGKNLHSHAGLASPLSRHNNEVTGYGADGSGDKLDDWKLECIQRKNDETNRDTSHNEKEEKWKRNDLVRFRHVDTNRWLSGSTKWKFNDSNCAHCPIRGELEISGTNRLDETSIFRAEEGVYLRVG